MVDLDKFICSLFDNGYGTIGMGDIKEALKQQGLEYKEGAIKPIESKPEFKEGDILYNKDSYAGDSIFIFKGKSDKTNSYLYYARLYNNKEFYVHSEDRWKNGVGVKGGEFYPANHKQKELLFSKMEESGYRWNPDTITLEKIESPSPDTFEIKKGNWYTCIKDCHKDNNPSNKELIFKAGKPYYSFCDGSIKTIQGYGAIIGSQILMEYFRPAKEEDFKNYEPRFRKDEILTDGENFYKVLDLDYNEHGLAYYYLDYDYGPCKGSWLAYEADTKLHLTTRLEMPQEEPDFEMMEAEYCTTLDISNGVIEAMIQSKMCSAYRKGLEDMWNKLKSK